MGFGKILFFSTMVVFTSLSYAAKVEAPVKREEIQQAQQKLQELENHFATHQGIVDARLDANDKRIGDFGVYVTMQGTQSTAVGNLIGMTGAGITIIAFFAGLITYFSATAKAKSEAREAVKSWFEEESGTFRRKIATLEDEVKSSQSAIAKLTKEAEAAIEQQLNSLLQRANIATKSVMENAALSEQTVANPAAVSALQQVNAELKLQPAIAKSAFGHYVRACELLSKDEVKDALDEFERALQLAATSPDSEKIHYLFGKGIALQRLGRAKEAIFVYDELDEMFRDDVAPERRDEVARALLNKGQSLFESERFDDALSVYDLIISRYQNDDLATIREQVASAMVNKGVVLGKIERPFEQIAAYDAVDAKYGTEAAAGLRDRVSGALLNKAIVLEEHGKVAEALKVYDDIDRRYQHDSHPEVREHVIKALVNKGATLGKAGQPEAANNVLKAVESRFKTDASQSARLRIANALFNRACALRDLGDIDGELSLYTAINEKFGLEEDSQMRRQVAMALYNKAILLGKRGLESSYAESIETFEVIIKTYGGDESVAVKKEVAKALVGLGFGKMIHAKQRYNDKPNYFLLLAAAISSFELALKICAEDLRSIVYGNLGYGHFLAGRAAEAGEFTRLCLESGGGGMLSLQRADAQLNRISDIDSQYENLLDSIWDKIAPGS